MKTPNEHYITEQISDLYKQYNMNNLFFSEIDRLIEQSKLYEGLIMSHDPNYVLRILIKRHKYLNKKIVHLNTNTIQIKVKQLMYDKTSNKLFNDITKIESVLNNLGWFISNLQYVGEIGIGKIEKFNLKRLIQLYNDKDIFVLSIIVEPKYNVNLKMKKEYYYHLAPTKLRSKILKNGLKPRSSNNMFNYPERLYLFLSLEIANRYIEKLKDEKELKELDLYKIEPDNDIRFMHDPNLIGAIFTLEPIAPYDIEYIETI